MYTLDVAFATAVHWNETVAKATSMYISIPARAVRSFGRVLCSRDNNDINTVRFLTQTARFVS